MEPASPDLGWMNLLLAGVLCVLALLWAWLSGRLDWHKAIAALVILSGVVLLTAVTVVVQFETGAVLFLPPGDLTHAGEAVLRALALNGALAALLWLALLWGLRTLGLAQRRRS